MEQKDQVAAALSDYDRQRVILFGNAKPSTGVSAHGGVDFPEDRSLTELSVSFHRHGGVNPYHLSRGGK